MKNNNYTNTPINKLTNNTTTPLHHFRRSFTLIEAIFVIIILSFVLIGGFQIISKLYVRNYIAKKSTKFEFTSQQTLDQISTLLYYRIPLSVIGYNQQKKDFKYIGEITDNNHTILEWIGYVNDAMVESNLSGFVDLYKSQKPILYAVDFHSDFINEVLKHKFSDDNNITNSTAVIFAGSFDRGEEGSLDDYNNSFGWHGNKHNYVFTIDNYNPDGDNCELNISTDTENKHIRIYEKFYLADTAYALALKKDLDKNKWHCDDLNWDKIDSNDLLLFYNYRPWKGETFCGDDNGTSAGNVSVLALNVNSFRIKKINSHLELKIQMLKSKGDINISISKQKVTF